MAHADFLLEQTWRWFPDETVFIVVVDPGVGTDRRPPPVRVAERMFVGPDNVLTSAIEAAGRRSAPHRRRASTSAP